MKIWAESLTPNVQVACMAACILMTVSAANGEIPSVKPGMVEYSDGHLTLDVQEMPLRKLLEKIGEAADFPVGGVDDLSHPVSFRFSALPLNQAVRRILGSQGNFLLVPPTTQHNDDNQKRKPGLWIVASGRFSTSYTRSNTDAPTNITQDKELPLEPYRDRHQEILDQYMQGLAEALPDQRKFAIEALADLESPRDLTVFKQAIRDPESELRQLALEALSKFGQDSAIPVIAMAMDDTSSKIREAAAKALLDIESPASLQSLRLALNHSDPKVREIAHEAKEKFSPSKG